jgi:predicted HTH transcriptional regulator
VASTVRPAINSEPLFGVEGDKTVLGLNIPKQCEPVFYYDYRPYLRDGSISRPATPDEVKELVWSHPSSEQKRFIEQTNRKWIEMIQNDSQRAADRSDEQQRMANRSLFRQ